jgi:hypothetical protein
MLITINTLERAGQFRDENGYGVVFGFHINNIAIAKLRDFIIC